MLFKFNPLKKLSLIFIDLVVQLVQELKEYALPFLIIKLVTWLARLRIKLVSKWKKWKFLTQIIQDSDNQIRVILINKITDNLIKRIKDFKIKAIFIKRIKDKISLIRIKDNQIKVIKFKDKQIRIIKGIRDSLNLVINLLWMI